MSERLNAEDMKLLEELFIQAGLFVDLDSMEDFDSTLQDLVQHTINSLTQAAEELKYTVEMVIIFAIHLLSSTREIRYKVKTCSISILYAHFSLIKSFS